MKKSYYLRLPLQNAYNVRDLGGYPASNGEVTAWHSFLRADDLCHLNEDDMQFLLSYGVKAIVDLRSEEEIRANPNPLASNKEINYTAISLMDDLIDDVTKVIVQHPEQFITSFYLQLIKNSQTAINRIFSFFAQQEEGCILFHCAAGKDRTGIIAMLLLGLCGVHKFDLIANYEVTHSNLKNNPEFELNLGHYPIEVMYSKADYIEPVIDFILDTYNDFYSYLRSIGLSDSILSQVKSRLI